MCKKWQISGKIDVCIKKRVERMAYGTMVTKKQNSTNKLYIFTNSGEIVLTWDNYLKF